MGEDLRLDGLAEGPPLHLGLEAHVGDLQAEAVPVHGGRVVGSLDEGWPSIDWEEAGGTCSAASKLLSTAFPWKVSSQRGSATGGSTCCGTLSRETLSLLWQSVLSDRNNTTHYKCKKG